MSENVFMAECSFPLPKFPALSPQVPSSLSPFTF